MADVSPISRADLVRRLRRLGFAGPVSGTRHQFMERGAVRVWLPNPHQGDVSVGLLSRLLRDAGIARNEWPGT